MTYVRIYIICIIYDYSIIQCLCCLFFEEDICGDPFSPDTCRIPTPDFLFWSIFEWTGGRFHPRLLAIPSLWKWTHFIFHTKHHLPSIPILVHGTPKLIWCLIAHQMKGFFWLSYDIWCCFELEKQNIGKSTVSPSTFTSLTINLPPFWRCRLGSSISAECHE